VPNTQVKLDLTGVYTLGDNVTFTTDQTPLGKGGFGAVF
jgi:hypothetical protein